MYHPVSEHLADLLSEHSNRPVEVLQTSGSIENRELLLGGQAEMALVQSSTFSAVELQIVTALYYERVFFVVRSDREISTIEDLRGRAVSIGPLGSGMRHSAVKIIEHFGIAPESLLKSTAYFRSLLTDATLDAAIVTTGTHNSDLSRLLSDGRFKLLPIPFAEELSREHPCFKLIHILPDDLPVKRSLPEDGLRTVMTPAFLVVRKDSPGLLVKTVLSSLYSESDLVTEFHLIPLKKAAEWRSWGLHPDADEFFESVLESKDP
jgi:TRAP transporter TAXI family solute receptor